MIGYLQGEILEHQDGKMIIGVGDRKSTGSVGYLVTVPQSAAYGGCLPAQKIELYVYTHVREESLDLYGFSSQFEKGLFLILLGVNGIGPKSALGMMSGVEPSQLVDAIIQGDQALLTRVPGVGKKTAERIVVELRDSLRKKVEAGTLGGYSKTHLSPKSASGDGALRRADGSLDPGVFRDAKEALVGLGYREQEIHQLLNRVLEDVEFRPKRAEELVRTALKQLG